MARAHLNRTGFGSRRDIARATGLTEGAIYWHLKQIYRKLPISRQVDLTTMSPTLTNPGSDWKADLWCRNGHPGQAKRKSRIKVRC